MKSAKTHYFITLILSLLMSVTAIAVTEPAPPAINLSEYFTVRSTREVQGSFISDSLACNYNNPENSPLLRCSESGEGGSTTESLQTTPTVNFSRILNAMDCSNELIPRCVCECHQLIQVPSSQTERDSNYEFYKRSIYRSVREKWEGQVRQLADSFATMFFHSTVQLHAPSPEDIQRACLGVAQADDHLEFQQLSALPEGCNRDRALQRSREIFASCNPEDIFNRTLVDHIQNAYNDEPVANSGDPNSCITPRQYHYAIGPESIFGREEMIQTLTQILPSGSGSIGGSASIMDRIYTEMETMESVNPDLTPLEFFEDYIDQLVLEENTGGLREAYESGAAERPSQVLIDTYHRIQQYPGLRMLFENRNVFNNFYGRMKAVRDRIIETNSEIQTMRGEARFAEANAEIERQMLTSNEVHALFTDETFYNNLQESLASKCRELFQSQLTGILCAEDSQLENLSITDIDAINLGDGEGEEETPERRYNSEQFYCENLARNNQSNDQTPVAVYNNLTDESTLLNSMRLGYTPNSISDYQSDPDISQHSMLDRLNLKFCPQMNVGEHGGDIVAGYHATCESDQAPPICQDPALQEIVRLQEQHTRQVAAGGEAAERHRQVAEVAEGTVRRQSFLRRTLGNARDAANAFWSSITESSSRGPGQSSSGSQSVARTSQPTQGAATTAPSYPSTRRTSGPASLPTFVPRSIPPTVSSNLEQASRTLGRLRNQPDISASDRREIDQLRSRISDLQSQLSDSQIDQNRYNSLLRQLEDLQNNSRLPENIANTQAGREVSGAIRNASSSLASAPQVPSSELEGPSTSPRSNQGQRRTRRDQRGTETARTIPQLPGPTTSGNDPAGAPGRRQGSLTNNSIDPETTARQTAILRDQLQSHQDSFVLVAERIDSGNVSRANLEQAISRGLNGQTPVPGKIYVFRNASGQSCPYVSYQAVAPSDSQATFEYLGCLGEEDAQRIASGRPIRPPRRSPASVEPTQEETPQQPSEEDRTRLRELRNQLD